MTQIKSRSWTSQQDKYLVTILQHLTTIKQQSTWNQIADLLKLQNPSSRKTGKQCRERWANQLNPKIKRTQSWTKQQNHLLFILHQKLGNKWSQISTNIPGRTDNSIKNHFYSTMRRGMRKINSYIQNILRKKTLIKTFKNEILNKILTLSEGKNDNKFQFNPIAKNLALQIKNNLIILSIQLSDLDQQNLQFKSQLFKLISQFARNCRKKKIKKSIHHSQSYQFISSQKSTLKSLSQSNTINPSFNSHLNHFYHHFQQPLENFNSSQHHLHLYHHLSVNQTNTDQINYISQKLNQQQLQHQPQTLSHQNLQLKSNNQIIQLLLQNTHQINHYPSAFSNTLKNTHNFINYYPPQMQINQQWIYHNNYNSQFIDINKPIQNPLPNYSNINQNSLKKQIQQIPSHHQQKLQIKTQKTIQIQNQQHIFNSKLNPNTSLLPPNNNQNINIGFQFSHLSSPFSLYNTPSNHNYYINNYPMYQQKHQLSIQQQKPQKQQISFNKYQNLKSHITGYHPNIFINNKNNIVLQQFK